MGKEGGNTGDGSFIDHSFPTLPRPSSFRTRKRSSTQTLGQRPRHERPMGLKTPSRNSNPIAKLTSGITQTPKDPFGYAIRYEPDPNRTRSPTESPAVTSTRFAPLNPNVTFLGNH